MKKIMFLICILGMSVQISYAQVNFPVYIESIGQSVNILIPSNGVVVGNFNVIVIPDESFYLDSCWLVIHGVLPQVISNLRFNREDHPEYNPYTFWGSIQSSHLLTLGEIYNFPPILNDTTEIEFIADIGVNVLPPAGSTLFVSLQCLGFSLSHEEISTNTAFGQTITISSTSGIEELGERQLPIVGGIGYVEILDQPVQVFDFSGIKIVDANENAKYYISSGMYYWTKENSDGKFSRGKIIVR